MTIINLVHVVLLLFQEVLIENLKPFTNYSVSVNFFNDVGKGPVATTFVKTIEGGQYNFSTQVNIYNKQMSPV
jgi:hypothetical protein